MNEKPSIPTATDPCSCVWAFNGDARFCNAPVCYCKVHHEQARPPVQESGDRPADDQRRLLDIVERYFLDYPAAYSYYEAVATIERLEKERDEAAKWEARWVNENADVAAKEADLAEYRERVATLERDNAALKEKWDKVHSNNMEMLTMLEAAEQQVAALHKEVDEHWRAVVEGGKREAALRAEMGQHVAVNAERTESLIECRRERDALQAQVRVLALIASGTCELGGVTQLPCNRRGIPPEQFCYPCMARQALAPENKTMPLEMGGARSPSHPSTASKGRRVTAPVGSISAEKPATGEELIRDHAFVPGTVGSDLCHHKTCCHQLKLRHSK